MYRPHVLIVDDNRAVHETIARFSRDCAAEVRAASSIAEAAVLLQRAKFEVIFFEVTLPDGAGNALLREARRHSPELVGVAMTGRTTSDALLEVIRSGACDCIIKPITAHKVLDAYERILQQRHWFVAADAVHTESLPALARSETAVPTSDDSTLTVEVPLVGNFEKIEEHLVRETIRRYDGNKSAAAKALGMHRRTLYRVLQRTA